MKLLVQLHWCRDEAMRRGMGNSVQQMLCLVCLNAASARPMGVVSAILTASHVHMCVHHNLKSEVGL